MKKRVFAIAISAVLALSGCAAERAADRAEGAMEKLIPSDAVETAAVSPRTAEPAQTTRPAETVEKGRAASMETSGAALTKEEAEKIALEHAGLTADQVTYLRADYEIDDGVPQYEVEFHQGHWEYDYEIHAETGQILSFEKEE